MKKALLGVILFFFCLAETEAQLLESNVQEGEFGISAGAAHYFGDLNPNMHLNRPKIALGAFFRKQFGNYIAVRVSGHFAKLGYSDIYNTQNEFEHSVIILVTIHPA